MYKYKVKNELYHCQKKVINITRAFAAIVVLRSEMYLYVSEFVSNILETSASIHKLGRGQINIHLNTFQIQTKILQIAA